MDKYKKYYGIIMFVAGIIISVIVFVMIVTPKYNSWTALKIELSNVDQNLSAKKAAQLNIQKKLKRLKESVITSQKKIYTPIEDKLGNDTLFFTLYNDVVEMVHSNTIKIKSIDYQYNPEGDLFVEQGAAYFVCDVNMEVVSNYTNLGKLIQDIYQYPYYIKINQIEVYPYPKDKRILLSKISLRLYAHTSPEDIITGADEQQVVPTMEGANTPLPQ